MDKNAVRRFEQLSRADVDFAGGKGANLGELTSAGLPVPPGFVVGASAYAAFCDESDLRNRIERRLIGLDFDDTAALERAAVEVRAAVEAEPLPGWLSSQVAEAYERLFAGQVAVAVRSAATVEDTASTSFAGMSETVLNVKGTKMVLDAVRRCWSSLFNARALYYRATRGYEQAEMDIAVVVQRQINARRAGVLFTLDPAAGTSDQMVVEAAFGLGESVVSGGVSTDRYVVLKQGLTMGSRKVGRKELAIEGAGEGGTVTRELPAAEAELPVLDDAQLRLIAKLGIRIEAHYNAPQDVEWAIDEKGAPWILQARPMVTGGDSLAPTAERGRELLHGLGAAPGFAVGSVRVIASLDDANQLAEDEILVAHTTAQVWSPLMSRAAAIVTDSGGMTCHAAVISRELGIPCLVGTAAATQVLRDGDVVAVDAHAGVVSAGDVVTNGV
jgi:pyruvate, water dikinase